MIWVAGLTMGVAAVRLANQMNSYDDKLKREKDWYDHTGDHSGFQKKHFLNSRLFYSPERVAYSTRFYKAQLAGRIREVLEQDHLSNPRLLIAPTGAGHELPYLLPLSQRIAGIDISSSALEAIPDSAIEKHLGDIKHMSMFEDGRFDVVIMSEFFHHFVKFGFDEFLLEARRVLRPGGHLFASEPSILHPFAAAAWCGKKLFGNVTGCVEDKSPFCPVRLTAAMRRCGFQGVSLWAASYSHHRMPIPLARIIHVVTRPLLKAPFFPHLAWDCIFHARKP
jgi:SAM-dependent methyltransferase